MDKVIQKHKTYKLVFNRFGMVSRSYHPPQLQNSKVEFVGSYTEANSNFNYIVALVPETVSEKETVYEFNSKFDVEISNKITVNEEDYTVLDKKYNLDGSVVYYIEDMLIKCENFEEIYEKEKEGAKQFLKYHYEKQRENMEEKAEKKEKSIWWYFGVR